ncbi:Methyltransferase type 11 [Acidisarcina polymorpha]|uniref:Methyltransferase type 11 n=1 Tax=Acidisarcina polymorpha TaxID=2211140 RepID=A0A2Z5G8Z8_9BACT|nr:class I SAM-dependent methyltransferase [Acidisarcina polymorpha]AXC15026.1 Methyltransferase type 11 [Acidisarcina polymorpha]
MAQSWDAAQYARQGRFVADMAGGVFDLLAAQAGETILDLGCGDGALTAKIAATGARVVGVDSSASMVEAARGLGLEAHLLPGDELTFDGEFDAVFSNAALHWMHNQDAVLAGVKRALKPGGRFVAEMGGHGNIASIRVALAAVFADWGLDAYGMDNNFFPTATDYRARLEAAGFSVETIALIPRPTPLPETGMRGWLETFRRGLLDRLPEQHREAAIEKTVALLKPVLHSPEEGWVADYVRLRFAAWVLVASP